MENNKKGGFGRRTEGRREYGSNTGKRPRISRAGTRGAERVFGDNNERPRRSFGDNSERRSFGGDRPRRSSGENSERRPFSGERRSGGFRITGKKSFS